jgi:hypothetical protein
MGGNATRPLPIASCGIWNPLLFGPLKLFTRGRDPKSSGGSASASHRVSAVQVAYFFSQHGSLEVYFFSICVARVCTHANALREQMPDFHHAGMQCQASAKHKGVGSILLDREGGLERPAILRLHQEGCRYRSQQEAAQVDPLLELCSEGQGCRSGVDAQAFYCENLCSPSLFLLLPSLLCCCR